MRAAALNMPASAASADRNPPPRTSLASNAASLALGSLFTQVAQILTLAVLARSVAKDQVATYQQMNLLFAVVAPMLVAGIPTALLYFIPRAGLHEERNAWIMRAYLLLGGMGVAAAVAVIAVRQPLASLFNNPDLATALVWYAPYMFFAFVAAVAPPALIASGHAGRAALLNGLVGALTITCVVVATIVSPTGDGLAAALSVSGALFAVASVSMVRRATGMRLARVHRRDGNTRRMLSYGLPLAATGLAGTLGYQFDRIVVGASFSPQEFAVYALGAVEVPLGLLIAAAVSNVLVPRLTILWRDGDRAGMIALWREAMRMTSLVLLPLFAFTLLMSSDLVLLLYGPGYSESVEVFRVYLFLLPLRIATWGLIPMALGRTGINLQASILILAVNAGVALALIGPLGLIGAALAAPISAVAAATYYLVRVRSIAALHVHELVPVRALTGTLAVSFLAAAPLFAIRELPVAAGIRLVVAAIIFGVIAPLGLRATHRISDDDWARLRGAIARLRRATHGA